MQIGSDSASKNAYIFSTSFGHEAVLRRICEMCTNYIFDRN